MRDNAKKGGEKKAQEMDLAQNPQLEILQKLEATLKEKEMLALGAKIKELKSKILVA